MSRRWLAAGIALALSACATAPRQSASESLALPGGGDVARAALPAQRGKSPYAPAQEDLSKRGHYTRGGLYKPGEADTVPSYVPDVDAIPEPEVVAEPRSRYGNRSPYTVLGKAYTVREDAGGYVEQGLASYYGNKFHGRRTSNLEVYDMYAFTAAHKSLPLPSFARVTNLDNGKSVVVRVNDRGPFHEGRVIDLSYAAAVKLGYRDKGTARVEVRGLRPGEGPVDEGARERHDAVAAAAPARSDAATGASALRLPPGVRIATGKPASASPAPATAASVASTGMDKLVGLLPIAAANAAEAPPAVSAAAARPATGNAATPGREWRFDMQQDGKAMTADEFDAWMKSRRARVATGRSGTPDPRLAVPAAATPAPTAASAAASTAAPAAAGAAGGQVTLQVASFASQTNAGHALGMLQRADIAARVLDANVNGKQVWRVRVGPVDAARAPELAARVVGLGFDPPQRVRD